MFGPLGFQEVLFILVLALLIIGPRKLPQVARTIGRTLSEFRKASTELKRSINAEIADEELRQSDPRKLVRETYDEVRSLGKDLTSPLDAPAAKTDPEAETEPEAGVKPETAAPTPTPAADAVSRGDLPASDAEPEATSS